MRQMGLAFGRAAEGQAQGDHAAGQGPLAGTGPDPP